MSAECITNDVAKGYVGALLGDGEARAPGRTPGRMGKPYFMFFIAMDALSARVEYEQIWQLPEHMRERDLMERMGLDGRVA